MELYQAHKQWASRPADQRFETLAALRDSVNARRMVSRAADVDLTNVKVEPAPLTEAQLARLHAHRERVFGKGQS